MNLCRHCMQSAEIIILDQVVAEPTLEPLIQALVGYQDQEARIASATTAKEVELTK